MASVNTYELTALSDMRTDTTFEEVKEHMEELADFFCEKLGVIRTEWDYDYSENCRVIFFANTEQDEYPSFYIANFNDAASGAGSKGITVGISNFDGTQNIPLYINNAVGTYYGTLRKETNGIVINSINNQSVTFTTYIRVVIFDDGRKVCTFFNTENMMASIMFHPVANGSVLTNRWIVFALSPITSYQEDIQNVGAETLSPAKTNQFSNTNNINSNGLVPSGDRECLLRMDKWIGPRIRIPGIYLFSNKYHTAMNKYVTINGNRYYIVDGNHWNQVNGDYTNYFVTVIADEV